MTIEARIDRIENALGCLYYVLKSGRTLRDVDVGEFGMLYDLRDIAKEKGYE